MFLLVSVRHVGAHPGGHQHGVSIQISINLGKTFLRISRIRNIPLTWILARVFVYVPPFISQILDFIYWTVLIFILIYFEWRDTENQQYRNWEITSLHNFLWKLSIQTWVCFFLSSSSFLLQAVIRSANCRLLISKSSCTFSTSTCFLSSRVDWTVLSPVSSSLLADCKIKLLTSKEGCEYIDTCIWSVLQQDFWHKGAYITGNYRKIPFELTSF